MFNLKHTRCRVWLDGIPLHELDPAILVTDVQEQPPSMNVLTHPLVHGDGLRVTKRTRQSLSVAVRFLVREYDTLRRKAVMQKIVAWANAGRYLTLSDRPGQRLRVEVDALPTITSALKWTQEMSLVFTAYAVPFWESEFPTTLTTAASAELMVPGNASHVPVEASIHPTGDTVTISVDATAITLTGLSGDVAITHDDRGLLRISSGGQSLLASRTPASSDDLLAVPGRVNTFSITGGTATFSVRGRWL